MADVPQLFGKWLKSIRRERGITQRDLAGMIGLGSVVALSEIEVGYHLPGPEFAKAIATALEIPDSTMQSQISYAEQDWKKFYRGLEWRQGDRKWKNPKMTAESERSRKPAVKGVRKLANEEVVRQQSLARRHPEYGERLWRLIGELAREVSDQEKTAKAS